MLMKSNRDEEILPSQEEQEVSFSGSLGEVRITRARAIKLAGAALGGSALGLLWAGEADARNRRRRRRRKKHRRRRRKAQVVSPTNIPLPLVPGDNILNIKNPSEDEPLTISGIKLLDSDGSVISTEPLVGGPVTIQPGETKLVTVNLDASDLVNADGLRLLDGAGRGITVIDENGVTVGDIDLL